MQLVYIAMSDEVETLRANLRAAKEALDAARDAFCNSSDADSRALYQAARGSYVAALRRFSAEVVGANGTG